MPGAVLRVIVNSFESDLFDSLSFTPCSIWHQGDLKGLRSRPDEKFETSGFTCNVSDVCGPRKDELDMQIADAIQFMSKHAESLKSIAQSPLIEQQYLDFGISLRINCSETVVQGEWLPVEFLELVAALKIGIAISIYPIGSR